MENLRKSVRFPDKEIGSGDEDFTDPTRNQMESGKCFDFEEYKTLKDMLTETDVDIDRIMDGEEEMNAHSDEDDGDDEPEAPSTSSMDMNCIKNRSNHGLPTDDQSIKNLVNHFNGFYEEMKLKVKSLKRTPIMKEPLLKMEEIDGGDLLKTRKHSAEVEKHLKFIAKLDEEIHEVIDTYHTERAARMEAQMEMCKELYNNPSSRDKDSEKFLDMCNFELSECGSDQEDEGTDKEGRKTRSADKGERMDTFVRRNIELAKQGYMANCSLTDEEKNRIEQMLKLQNKISEQQKVRARSAYTVSEDTIKDDPTTSNAYLFDEGTSKRMNDIDVELEKFAMDEMKSEKYESGLPKDIKDIRSELLLKKEIACIDMKLKTLKKIEADTNKEYEQLEAEREKLESADENDQLKERKLLEKWKANEDAMNVLEEEIEKRCAKLRDVQRVNEFEENKDPIEHLDDKRTLEKPERGTMDSYELQVEKRYRSLKEIEEELMKDYEELKSENYDGDIDLDKYDMKELKKIEDELMKEYEDLKIKGELDSLSHELEEQRKVLEIDEQALKKMEDDIIKEFGSELEVVEVEDGNEELRKFELSEDEERAMKKVEDEILKDYVDIKEKCGSTLAPKIRLG